MKFTTLWDFYVFYLVSVETDDGRAQTKSPKEGRLLLIQLNSIPSTIFLSEDGLEIDY